METLTIYRGLVNFSYAGDRQRGSSHGCPDCPSVIVEPYDADIHGEAGAVDERHADAYHDAFCEVRESAIVQTGEDEWMDGGFSGGWSDDASDEEITAAMADLDK